MRFSMSYLSTLCMVLFVAMAIASPVQIQVRADLLVMLDMSSGSLPGLTNTPQPLLRRQTSSAASIASSAASSVSSAASSAASAASSSASVAAVAATATGTATPSGYPSTGGSTGSGDTASGSGSVTTGVKSAATTMSFGKSRYRF